LEIQERFLFFEINFNFCKYQDGVLGWQESIGVPKLQKKTQSFSVSALGVILAGKKASRQEQFFNSFGSSKKFLCCCFL
jgi:hypothetical protein